MPRVLALPIRLALPFSAALMLLLSTALAGAEFKTEWQIREFVSGRTLEGVTVKDHERWNVRMGADGSFRMQNTNRRVDRGQWVVQGQKLHFMFDRAAPICRMISVDAGGTQGWHDCGTGEMLSVIVSPTYDAASLDGANRRKAEAARGAQEMMRGIQGNMPSNDVSVALGDMIDRYLDAGIARILSPEGQKLHAAAVQRAWVTGQPQVWTNSSANESGRVTLGERIIGADGQVRQVEKAEVYKDGQAYETQRDICFGPDGAHACG